jgi:hypothetical protein
MDYGIRIEETDAVFGSLLNVQIFLLDNYIRSHRLTFIMTMHYQTIRIFGDAAHLNPPAELQVNGS